MNTIDATSADSFRDNVKTVFKQHTVSKYNYEHKVEECHLSVNTIDYYNQKRNNFKKLKKSVQENNAVIKSILKKRNLTAQEQRKYNMLLNKHNNNTITYDESLDFETLHKIQFANSGEKASKNTINGVDTLYYYKNARTELKKKKIIEWNNTCTVSREKKIKIDGADKLRTATIIVSKEKSINYIKSLNQYKPVIIATVSHLNPGGSWERGDEGGEEFLFYSSTLSLSLCPDDDNRDGFYPLVEDATLYSPKVMLYTQKKSAPVFVSIISCSGFRITREGSGYRQINKKINKNRLSQEAAEIYKDKVRNVLQTALYWGHQAIIFDSFGCINNLFDYQLPARHCAELIKEVIFDKESLFYKKFRQIIFCIHVENKNNLVKLAADDSTKLIYESEIGKIKKSQYIYEIFYSLLHNIDEHCA